MNPIHQGGRWGVIVAVALAAGETAAWEGRAGAAETAPGQSVRIAGIVLKWVRPDKEANFRRLEPLVREAAKNGARVVVTTESFLDGYAVADKSIPLERYRALGEAIPGGAYYRRL